MLSMAIGVLDPPLARESAAAKLDCAVVEIARSRGAIELALGEALARLFDTDGLIRLGYSKRVDYARERLGVPARTMYGWVRLARALVERPLLRRAVVGGFVSPRAASVVSPLAVGESEAAWIATAMQLPLVELERVVRAEGADSSSEYGQVESLILHMTEDQQDQLDEAIGLAEEQNGFEISRWQCVEIICQEWLGEFGAWAPVVESAVAPDPPELAGARRAGDTAILRQLCAVELAAAEPPEHETAVETDARIQLLLEGRRGFDMAFGAVATRLISHRIWRELGYHGVEEYCRERLGISPRSFRERVWLERRMCALPQLRVALESGKLTYSKALLVAKDARAHDVADRIEDASTTTWQQVERESSAEEDRRNRAQGIRRLWGPEDAVRTIADAITCVRLVAVESGMGVIDSGHALALIATHYIQVWEAHRNRRPPPRRRKVLSRHDGLCAVPGCSAAAQHEHHIEYRSRGGGDDPANLLGLCAMHHLRGVHAGNLRVCGSAGERLEWHFGNGEEWVTYGDDWVGNAASADPLSDSGEEPGTQSPLAKR